MSCCGLCSVQFPWHFSEPGLISALVTVGRPAGSWLLLEPGKTKACAARGHRVSACAAIPKRTGLFSPSSPWEVLHFPGQVPHWWLWLLRGHQRPLPARFGHAAGRSRHCCSHPCSPGRFLVPHPTQAGSLLLPSCSSLQDEEYAQDTH